MSPHDALQSQFRAAALAQDTYREAFNHAFEARMGGLRQAQAAHRIAAAAVKRHYVKESALWVVRA